MIKTVRSRSSSERKKRKERRSFPEASRFVTKGKEGGTQVLPSLSLAGRKRERGRSSQRQGSISDLRKREEGKGEKKGSRLPALILLQKKGEQKLQPRDTEKGGSLSHELSL